MGWSFGRKKNKEGSAADSNPYAQQPAADPYAHQYASPAQSQATLSSTTSSGPRPGGLPSGPAPYHNNQAPPPYSAGGPVQQPPAAGRYTNERFGTTDRYGDNRYDTASTSNYNRYEPSVDSKQSQLYNSSKYSSNASASTSAQPSPVKQHYPVQYGDNKQPGQFPPDGPQEYQPTPQEIYGNKFGVPEEELDEEQKQELEVDRTKNDIMRTHQENLESLNRTNQHLDNILALAGNAVEMTARQGESLDRVELNSIQAIRKAEKAGDTTKYLGKLNSRPFFVPAVSRKGLREMDEKTIMDESMEKMERHKARAAQYQGRQAVEGLLPGQRKGLLGAKASKKYDAFEVDDEARSKFTFEDDDGQQEAMLKQQFEHEKNLMMKMEQVHGISVGLGQAIDRQNRQVDRITENVSSFTSLFRMFWRALCLTIFTARAHRREAR
ncbi:hypothetical protein B0T20DRAFT_49194 [Sordaria brevicollis]|uniref:t-SNARE coiled-coil homology domain-containing protein n=1 Tax=Sordaria brevicollis TaxID=83679 RepID=A0AAE0P9P5_SORBR|nr:hypothetical protein B0T20DRAFT_49194 [Sordaria brevicollis]